MADRTPMPFVLRRRSQGRRARSQRGGHASWPHAQFWRTRVKPLLCGAETCQARDLGSEIDVLPLGVESGRMKLALAIEQTVDKTRHAPIAVGFRIPVISNQDGRRRNRVDAL